MQVSIKLMRYLRKIYIIVMKVVKMDELLQLLRDTREAKHISRKKIAENLNKAPETLRDIESGKMRLSVEDFLIICDSLELPAGEVLEKIANGKNIVMLDLTEEEISALRNLNNKINKALVIHETNNNKNITIGSNNSINNSFNN